jgi:hypothetical protein
MDGAESPTTKWTEFKGGAYIYKTCFLFFFLVSGVAKVIIQRLVKTR